MSEPMTLPMINLLSDPNILATLWNYTRAVVMLGMPFLLITIALMLIPRVWELIQTVFDKARGRERRRNDEDDEDEDDDW
jgi:hypothetical protein